MVDEMVHRYYDLTEVMKNLGLVDDEQENELDNHVDRFMWNLYRRDG